MTTIKDIQKKMTDKIEQKYKGSVTKQRLEKIFKDFDKDHDGFLSLNEFTSALRDAAGNPLSKDEADFLFQFWDTLGGQADPQGAVQLSLLYDDLLASLPQYGTGFNSGADHLKTNKGGNSNKPSQEGGIFGGGAWEADERRQGRAPEQPRAPMAPMGMAPMPVNGMGGAALAAPASKPKGNQSSIEGGIFGEAAPTGPPAQPSTRANRSNQSSIEGGIFGEAGPAPAWAPPRSGKYSNQSSIPGGIFG